MSQPTIMGPVPSLISQKGLIVQVLFRYGPKGQTSHTLEILLPFKAALLREQFTMF